MDFPLSGIHVSPLVPFLSALAISLVTSMSGISGGVILVPFQMSVLGIAGVVVTPTNHLFNVLATPVGVYRYFREGRMVWPLTALIVIATVPGVIAGTLARLHLLHGARQFKLFVGLVLLLLGLRLLRGLLDRRGPVHAAALGGSTVEVTRFDLRRVEYAFGGEVHGVGTSRVLAVALAVGVVGGAYGIGGGALVAPVLVSVFDLPVHSIAGATLCGTFVGSLVGVVSFGVAQRLAHASAAGPDWMLGSLLGAGGLCGIYLGARLQKRVPAKVIEGVLCVLVLGIAGLYLVGILRGA